MPYNEQFMPKSLMGKLSLMTMPGGATPAQRAGMMPPQRSKMLADMMTVKSGPDANDYTNAALQAGVGLGDAYRAAKAPEGVNQTPEEINARRNQGYSSAVNAVASAAGGLIPGWGGRIAQLAALMASEYGKTQQQHGKREELQRLLSETDPEKRARMAIMLSGEESGLE